MCAKVVIADVSDERGEALAREVGAGSLYMPTDCMGEDSIAEAVKAAAGLGPLRAAVITHIGPDWPGGRGPARVPDPDGVRHPLAKFAHVINVYLNSAFAVQAGPLKRWRRTSSSPRTRRGVIINTASIAGFKGQPGQAVYSGGAAVGVLSVIFVGVPAVLGPVPVGVLELAVGDRL
jgi:NAD(P)-dependent dehydrogenase (short-subunit alcohol dehydrogenase family)